jgi:hypothetical protein
VAVVVPGFDDEVNVRVLLVYVQHHFAEACSRCSALHLLRKLDSLQACDLFADAVCECLNELVQMVPELRAASVQDNETEVYVFLF